MTRILECQPDGWNCGHDAEEIHRELFALAYDHALIWAATYGANSLWACHPTYSFGSVGRGTISLWRRADTEDWHYCAPDPFGFPTLTDSLRKKLEMAVRGRQ